ncbi:MAG: MBOAT family O-acyltransferase [Ferruginibacter sp.]
MIFNSIIFLIFFSIFFFLFYYLNGNGRKILLFIGSCLFYMWFVPAYVLILFLTILIDYYAAIKIEDDHSQKAKKRHLLFGIVNTCLVLFVFKYYNFFIENFNALGIKQLPYWDIILPIGLSFHTFQSLSYVIEVYRGNIKAERSILVYSNFVMMFPQLVAGPIERANNLLPQLKNCDHKITYSDFAVGFHRFFWGLFKKVVVADITGIFVDATYNNYNHQPGVMLFTGTILFSIQVYCDFSGYSDMAIGIARMLGFKFKENFRIPFFSKDITEFWRRWHISLSSWLRDYVYISLGGSRLGKLLTYRNLMITMIICGIWHGATWNYVIFGAIQGTYLSVEKLVGLPKLRPKHILAKGLRVMYVFVFISFSFIFFRAVTFDRAMSIIKSIFLNFNAKGFRLLDTNIVSTIVIGISILMIFDYFVFRNLSFDQIYERKNGSKLLFAFTTFLIFLIIFFGNSNGSQFIYFQF